MSIVCLPLVNSKADSYFGEHVWFNPEDSIDSRIMTLVRDYGDDTVLYALMQVVPPETEYFVLETEDDSQAFYEKVKRICERKNPSANLY